MNRLYLALAVWDLWAASVCHRTTLACYSSRIKAFEETHENEVLSAHIPGY
jgi:hypothetical protein